MSEPEGEKKHKPTPRFRKKLREEGRFARSEDLGGALLLLTAMSVLWFTGPGLFSKLGAMVKESLSMDALPRPYALVDSLRSLLAEAFWLLLPLLSIVCATAILCQWFQSGFQLYPGKLAPESGTLEPCSRCPKPNWLT